MPFYFTKISNVGTSNPIVARLSCGFQDIIKLARLPKEDRQKITDSIFDISEALLEAENCAQQVITEIKGIEKRITRESIKNTTYRHPEAIESVLSLNRVRDFLKYSKSAFRKLGRIISISFKISNNEHRFENTKEELRKNKVNDTFIFDIFSHYKPLYQKIMKLRNDDEHDKDIDEFLFNYKIKMNNNFYYLERPHLYDGTNIYDFLKKSSSLLLSFCEDIVVACLVDHLPEVVEIIEVPLQDRDPKCPKRFRVTLAGHL